MKEYFEKVCLHRYPLYLCLRSNKDVYGVSQLTETEDINHYKHYYFKALSKDTTGE